MSNRRSRSAKRVAAGTDGGGVAISADHTNDFDDFHDDLLGEDDAGSDDDDRDKKGKRRGFGEEEEDANKPPSYMFFDFRKGGDVWPTCVELVDPKRADELLEKATAAAEEAAKKKKKDDDDEGGGGGNKKDSGVGSSYNYSSWDSTPEVEEEGDVYKLHPDATFETLKDGSSALVLKPGYRLRLKLNDLQEGGDDAKVERDRKAAKSKKKAAQYSSSSWMGGGGGGMGGKDFDFWDMDAFGGGKKWFKEKINEYTVTIDMKLLEEPPRDGISLFQTALIHSAENKRTGKTTLTRSDGECLINQAGGVGLFGTFGDTTRARLEPGVWRRVVVAVKCTDKQNEKGEIRTWVNTEPGVVLKEESIVANERFSIDPDSFFLFSSAQTGMMPGSIAIRTIRVEMTFASDKDVRSNRARDKVLSIFDEERKKEAEEQRKGLCLAGLFPKPRPMWMAPAFVAAFGDAFVEKSTLEGSSNLAWSYSVLNYALQRMLKNPLFSKEDFGLDYSARVALSDSLHIMQQSAAVFKLMVRMLKTPTESQLLSFLRKLKKLLQGVNTGETLILPAFVESRELIILLERTSERLFKVVVVQTDPYKGLRHHTTSPVAQMPHVTYRTCMVLNEVAKKNVLDDVFWMALYNMAIHHHDGDTDKFYDVLIPFLTGKPLEASLVEAENAAAAAAQAANPTSPVSEEKAGPTDPAGDSTACEESKASQEEVPPAPEAAVSSPSASASHTGAKPPTPENCGEWRLPQRSNTAYVRCTLEAFHFLLRRRHVTDIQAKQIHLCLCSELVRMMQNDLNFMLPNQNGVRVCSLAIKELSHLAVQLVDEAEVAAVAAVTNSSEKAPTPAVAFNGSLILNEVHEIVQSAEKALAFCRDTEAELPPHLDLTGAKAEADPQDLALSQCADVPMWDVINTDSDPGQSVAMQKYVPVDLLLIPAKASTIKEAISAIRICDRQCSLIENQSHCIKNKKFLIAAAIEHVFTQVVPVPKPRKVGLSAEELHRTGRAERRTTTKAEEEKTRAAEKKKRIEEREEKVIAAGGTARKKPLTAKKAEPEAPVEEKVKCFGTEVLPDFEEGKKIEADITEDECIWDIPIHYELQVELLLTLQRLSEHFVAASMSLVQSRPFDATCIIVSGCLAALSDALMRKIAVDEPSEMCSHLSGRTVSGRQLGHPGFGVSVGTFATQCETLEIHTPELSIARTAVLDYFQSPQQRRLEKIFTWEEDYILKPGKNLIKYLRLVSKEIGLPIFKPHHMLIDGNPMYSEIMKNYPEFRCYRDIVFFWKYFLNTDRKAFKNYVSADNTEVPTIERMHAQLSFAWDDNKNGYMVTCFEAREELACRPNPKQINPMTGKVIPPEHLPTHRYPSTATPSFYVPAPAIKTEDDVIYRPNLPNFEDTFGQVLNQRDSELLISYLTVPYMRIPLILAFFSSEDRIHKLQSPELRLILDSVMFEPGKYLRLDMCNVEPMMVPTPHADLLASAYGLLLNELCRSPETVIRSVISLLRGALACDTGAVVDEDATVFNTSTMIIIYVTRLASRVDNYLSFLIDYTEGTHECIDWPLREADVSPETFDILKKGREELRELLTQHFHPLFEDYLRRLDYETVNDPTNESLIDRNSRLACDLHAHMLLIYRNHRLDAINATVVKTVIGSFIYLTTRHTWNKIMKEENRIHLPETELYSLLQVQRRRVVKWLANCRQGALDEVMQTALQVSSSLTGSFKASADVLDAQNRWSRIQGSRSVGRWAVGSTRNVATSASSNALAEAPGPFKSLSLKDSDSAASSPRPGLQRQASFENAVAEIADTGMLGVEIDVQIGQMTLRSKHLAALITDIANHQDVRMIFGETTMQASLVESAEHRSVYRLVGLNHELHFWRTPHTICPPLGDEWDREYDPAELADSEKWMAALFEPVRKSFFDGPSPPPMQFMMTEKPSASDAEVAVILGLHQFIGGPFKLVYLFRRLRCVHVYECVSQGREWFYSLHLATDNRFALRDMQPSAHHRDKQYPDWWIRGAGLPYPTGIRDFLSNDITGMSLNHAQSVLIVREQQHHANISGGRETLVPERLLYGVVPHALLDSFRFWEDESLAPRGTKPADFARLSRGYKRLLGYPIVEEGEQMMIVEFQFTGSWTDFIPPAINTNAPQVLQSTGFPGRTVRITRKPKACMEEDFRRRQRIASVIDSLKILVPPARVKKAAEETDGAEKEEMLFKVDAEVECNYEGKEEFWPCVVRRVNDDMTYDLEYLLEYKWLGVQRGVDPAIVQKRGEGEKKKRGEGVWHWEGMSASEEDDWRSASDNEKEEEESYEDKEKKQRMTFHQFDELNTLLEAAGGDEEECIAAIKKLSHRFPAPTYTELEDLCKAVKQIVHSKSFPSLGPSMTPLPEKASVVNTDDDLVLLNLLYAPRRSRLHSILKVLTRIENAGHILAWTYARNVEQKSATEGLAFGCPPIDLIELPRLKLSFTARLDHEGNLRLYSVDHVDLFISNESSAMTAKMLAGIPHSLILSNVRGETQVLVPVIPPIRPRIATEPFSTFIILDRKKIPLAERFFLYPVHISFSFLLTKGLNSALYLMLLRFLHRDYADVFRLSDSIATDTKLNEEGLDIYKAFKSVTDDWHPDAHACRLKISLVTIDAGMEAPWDLTTECARHSVKLDSVSSSCRMAAEEELQLLESDFIVMSTSSKDYNKDVHDEYTMALCYNRQQVLRAQLQQLPSAGPEGVSVSCRAPPRALSTSWPYYQDNTVFGENYMQMREVTSADDGEHSWEVEVKGGDETDAPEGGWLVVAVFHTLWSAGCVKVLPSVTELVPMYQNMLNFVSVKADCQGMVAVSKQLEVNEFPTFILFRGGKEIERLVGHERVVEKLVRTLGTHLTVEDKAAHAKHRHRIRLEKALEMGLDSVPEEEESEERGQLDWTFDPEQCGESMQIEHNGMLVTLAEEQEKDDTQWEYTTDHRRKGKWTPFPPLTNHKMEKKYKDGSLYGECSFYGDGFEIYINDIQIGDYEVTGFYGYDKDYNDIYVRRSGDRCPVPNEEQYLTKEQKERDKRSAEWRNKLAAYKLKMKEQRIGKDIEAMRGTISFLPNTGHHYWTFMWNHEPGRGGKCDAFGICSDAKEDFGAGPSPYLGGADTGITLGLYADGSMYHNGILIHHVKGTRNDDPVVEVVKADDAAQEVAEGEEAGEEKEGEGEESAPHDEAEAEDEDAAEEEEVAEEGEPLETETSAAVESKETEPEEGAAPAEAKPKASKKKKADLFGRKSIVRIDFDTALDGGTLTFTVDGKLLEDVKLTDVYTMLGASEIFPCICMSPLDPMTEKEKKALKKQQDRLAKEAQKRAENGEEENEDGENNGEATEENGEGEEGEEEEEEEAEEGEEGENDGEGDGEGEGEGGEEAVEGEGGEDGEVKKKKKKKKIPELEFDIAPSVTLYSREEEEKLNAPPKEDLPVPAPEEGAPAGESLPEGVVAPVEGEVPSEVAGEAPAAPTETGEEAPAPVEEVQAAPPTEDTLEVPVERVRWMYETAEEGWKIYSVDASRELEEASRDGKTDHTLTIGTQVHKCKLETKKHTRDDADGEFRLRRHVLGDGLAGMWEVLTMKYERPSGLYGLSVLKLLEKVWGQNETMSGKQCGLGFMFLYSLFTGDSRAKVSGGSYGDYGGKSSFVGPSRYGGGGSSSRGGGSASNDSHRFALLLTQLYTDKHTKSLPGSVINVLGRNRQVSLRMPKFKDTRKAQQSPFFNGWVDDSEPRSPLAELFGKLVPMMGVMKRKGAFHFPPPPPHLELPSPPATGQLLPEALPDWVRPELSDYGCESRTLAPISTTEVATLISSVQYRLSNDALKPSLPIHIEDSAQFDSMIKAAPEKLYVVYFHANWCGPCKSLSPVFNILSLQTPTVVFCKIDIDECDDLVTRFEIEVMPTVIFLRGSPEKTARVGTITGAGPAFIVEFPKMLAKVATEQETILQKNFAANTPGKNVGSILQNISCSKDQIHQLAFQPLQDCNPFVTRLARMELGLKPVNADLAFDVYKHEHAQTAPAVSVLTRFKDDVTAYASYANTAKMSKVLNLSDGDVNSFFDSGADEASRATAEARLTEALAGVRDLIKKLYELRDTDAQMVQDTIPMLECAANWVPGENEKGLPASFSSAATSGAKTRFLLNRIAGQNAFVWVEFLFGMLLSSKGEADLLKLNPYLTANTVTAIMHLITMSMLRANRLGHTNRCIGTAISLEGLLAKSLKVAKADRDEEGKVLIPKLIQVGEELAKTITLARHYMTELAAKGLYEFDPRYLVFEFVWNIQLRQKQVEIVNDFRNNLNEGTSKVKQMIMGAGKTSVVAPLLALIVADGKSLVLSVVPKALVEMSRTRMRETFAAIMVKRIYTLDFDRSTTVTPSMRRSLENAAANRGVVVATPTTLKSIMLSYIETLQQIREAKEAGGMRMKLAELTANAGELAKILALFKEGVMLLDEVDLILHPLKSELNFPIGDKFDLDGSDEGERWGLPIHLLDALFFNTTGRVSTFEQRGVALDILKRISATIQQGIQGRHLQRLPHVTLLNYEFYNEKLKPVMAEWAYLWLQKNHLHGIDRLEAVQYLLEGAAARSDTSTKITMLELAIAKIKVAAGQMIPGPVPTLAYQRSMTAQELALTNQTMEELRLKNHSEVDENQELERLLAAQAKQLDTAKEAALEHQSLVNAIYTIDEELEENSKVGGRKLADLQGAIILLHKKIAELECPRDDSLDNSIVVWYSQAFAIGSGAASDSSSGVSSDSSVPTICSLIEDMGMTVKRCCDAEEAISRARDLQEEGLLRCLIVGGEERGMSCGPSCVKKHTDLDCMRCGQRWESHTGHECSIGGRGSWPLEKADEKEKKVNSLQMMKSLTDVESAYARAHAPLPSVRTCVYSAHSTMKEEERMDFWKLGTTVTDDSKQLLAWVNGMPGWKAAEEEDVDKSFQEEEKKEEEKKDENKPFVRPAMRRQSSHSEKNQLGKFKEELEVLETKKAAAGDDDEVVRKRLLVQVTEKHALLDLSVQRRILDLSEASLAFQRLIAECQVDSAFIQLDSKAQYVGPHSGRDAALAMGWLEVNKEKVTASGADSTVEVKKLISKHSVSVDNELSFLKQMALAAKVVAHVTSPMHKKLLNLCHNWLSTFLPHCLAKVNRVSFGLLSMEDCKAALLADPHVPRSRLKLGVPFVGKDVPSRSSEFAHPDVIIGLTVLAYRYTGLRKDDFIDIIDSMTSQFSQEIGPARDRESSQRHEKWVFAAGGAIRGLKTTREGQAWALGPQSSEEDQAAKEVVQLKFLQKSNKEQMDKLFELIRYEPLVIHHYLQRTIFPTHMRSQRMKISASGQAVGGDMLVGKRVGFSGTPSDLLPQELGRCDYETGDDGMMLTTCLDRNVTSYEFIQDEWTVEHLLEMIATTENPRYHALIDTGALITGYSNQEVAQQLLDRGLTWCEGVVFLDDDDKQQVLVRATGRVVSADQCGVSLERRFAFYDQIHTTGMDIKHVVNATAVITLGKDMVFRDYVQGAYRMRGIGVGQRVHVFIIPEVKELMQRELREAVIPAGANPDPEIVKDHVLEDVVAWLVVNSLRSEQTQWTMLCLQNIGNLYRKNAFKCLTAAEVVDGAEEVVPVTETEKQIANLSKADALLVFDESIDFSLEAGVPDPLPFEKKLRSMLDEHEAFLLPEQHKIGHSMMEVVGQFSMIEGSANRLDTEQEREQEQEQEKEVEARRDQQIEVEKFVDREFSRQEEVQRPWAFHTLAQPLPVLSSMTMPPDHPFYRLRDFKLRHHEPLEFPDPLLVSSNYFNPNWTGLRRVKNVVMLLEFAPSTTADDLRLKTQAEEEVKLSETQIAALRKAHSLLGFHAGAEGNLSYLAREDLRHAVQAFTDEKPTDKLLDSIIERFSKAKNGYLNFEEFTALLTSGILHPQHVGRYYVAVSLAEAETIRRILHIRKRKDPGHVIPKQSTEIALRYSPMATPGSLAGDGGVIFDASSKWNAKGTGATAFEAAVAHNSFRFFDCDMHFSLPALNVLVRSLHGSTRDRERFFFSTVGCRRRMERKWQETPLAKVFTVPDEWAALKQQAQAVFIIEALKARNLTLWEAFSAFDYDNNGILAPSEFYGALRWLGVPNLTAEDVVDFIEAADTNNDGMVDYKEYMDMLSFAEDTTEAADEEKSDLPADAVAENRVPIAKVEPYGAEVLREIMVQRRQAEQARIREERLRKQAYHDALDVKVFEEELDASRLRKGGANPAVATLPEGARVTKAADAADATETAVEEAEAVTTVAVSEKSNCIVTDFRFSTNQHPLRFIATGKSNFYPIHYGTAADPPAKPMRCAKQHVLTEYNYYWMDCERCHKRSTNWCCWTCYKFFCSTCYDGEKRSKDLDRRDPAKHPTFLRCLNACSFSLQVPLAGGANPTTGKYTLTMELRFEKLPLKGSMQSLLRFSLPDLNQARKMHRTSVYLNADGIVVGRPLESGGGVDPVPEPAYVPLPPKVTAETAKAAETTEETKAEGGEGEAAESGDALFAEPEAPKKVKPVPSGIVKVRPQRWAIVSISVNPEEGTLSAYLDGKLCSVSTELDPSDLRLHHKVVVLGGGKQAHMRGGDIRRVVIHSDALHGADVMDVYLRLASDHPGIGGRVARIQAIWRGFYVRKLAAEEVARNLAEFNRENEEEAATEAVAETKEGEGEPVAAPVEGSEGAAEVAVGEASETAEPAATEAEVEETTAAEEVKLAN